MYSNNSLTLKLTSLYIILSAFILIPTLNPPANKSTNTIYYYTIREVGGIATHAYNDGRYDNLDKNPYYNSNNTAESYLFEMGYLDNVQDLRNIQSNKEGYAKGVVTALQEYLK